MPKSVGWSNLPAELKERKQWCVSFYTHPDPLKRKAPREPRGDAPFASILNPEQWGTFEEAARYAWEKGTDDWCIGFVLTDKDPICAIDMDVKNSKDTSDPLKWTTPEQLDFYQKIAVEADSYVERSLSGKSLHVLLLANIGQGVRHKGVEIYSQERYIICTGDVWIDKPLRASQQMIDSTLKALRSEQIDTKAVLVEKDETESDEEVSGHLSSALNGDKYNELFNGRWEQYGYPSQSEADLALMSMFAFRSPSNEQCRRLFRLSELGKRRKADRNDKYLDYTLSIIRGRQEREEALENAAISKLQAKLLSCLNQLPPVSAHAHASAALAIPAAPVLVPADNTAAPLLVQQPSAPQLTAPLQVNAFNPNEIQWPPGYAGEIARFMYETAPRPVKEVAIVAAMGLLAGITAKVYTLPQSGLNIYFVLVARSAVGKEAMHSGIACVLEGLRERNPLCERFVDFSNFASGPALIKAVIKHPCFVNVSGEWGRKLKRLADDNGRDTAMQSLRTTMTDLYQKSGPTSIVGGISYSKKEDSVQSVAGVAYSMIGETTPTTYYESLTESMMEDGFLSRFTMLEYKGDRPPLNKNPKRSPPPEMSEHLTKMCGYVLARITGLNAGVNVLQSADAADLYDMFDKECDQNINNREDESWRQMWNRAHLKALRFGGLLAVADNFIDPVITSAHAQWAIDLIRRDIKLMQKKMSEGDVGAGDDAREKKLLTLFRDYITDKPGEGYDVPETMRQERIIQRKYIQIRMGRVAAFTKHRSGSVSVALDQALKSLMDSGYIKECPREKLIEKHGYQGKCYLIVDLPK